MEDKKKKGLSGSQEGIIYENSEIVIDSKITDIKYKLERCDSSSNNNNNNNSNSNSPNVDKRSKKKRSGEENSKREEEIAFRELVKELTQNPNLLKGTCDIVTLTFTKYGYTCETFMKMLEKRYTKALKLRDRSKAECYVKGIALMLTSWISNCIKTDFLPSNGINLYNSLLEFIEKIKLFSQVEANKIKLALIRYNPRTVKRYTKRNSSKSRASYKGKLLEFPASIIAEQITLFEYNIYSRITPSELINCAWNKKDKATTSPRVVLMVERFNSVSYWVSNQICGCRDFKDRINLLSTFISLANDLAILNNFNGLMEILGGLNNSSVQRLKKTWAAVQEKYGETWEKINTLMDSKNNYVSYRDHLQTSALPAIPFLGVYLRDLTFIEDGNPEWLISNTKKLNTEKFQFIGGVFSEIQKFQSTAYSFTANRELQHYFAEVMQPVPEDADDVLYELSILAEPPSTISSVNVRLVDKDKQSGVCKSMSV